MMTPFPISSYSTQSPIPSDDLLMFPLTFPLIYQVAYLSTSVHVIVAYTDYI